MMQQKDSMPVAPWETARRWRGPATVVLLLIVGFVIGIARSLRSRDKNVAKGRVRKSQRHGREGKPQPEVN